MKRFFLGACGMLFITFVTTAQSATVRPDPRPTICSISANPELFDGKNISVSAHFESDGIERTALTDPNCPEVVLAITGKGKIKGEEKLVRALQMGHPGTLDKTITGTFTGKFMWKPREAPKRIIELKEVHNISAVMK